MDFEKALLLLKVVELSLGHGPAFRNIQDEAMRELREMNDSLNVVGEQVASEPIIEEPVEGEEPVVYEAEAAPVAHPAPRPVARRV